MACENHMRTEERLDRLEGQVERLMTSSHRSDVWQAETDLKLSVLSEKMDKMDYKFTQMFNDLNTKVQAIAEKPTKRIDMMINTGLTVLTSALVTFMITQIVK